MLTPREIYCSVMIPAVISALIAAIGLWRRWRWPMPAAAGLGFLAGYFVLAGFPKLPPQDGTDWLFWAAFVLIILAIVDAAFSWRWGWISGVAAGGVALLIASPLVPGSVPWPQACGCAVLIAAWGAAMAWIAQFVEARLGPPTVVAALCVAVGAAGVLVLSCNLRTVGVYGIAGGAALGPVALLIARLRAGRSVAIVAAGILAGLLVGGRYYPDPGVSWVQLTVSMAAPLLILPCAFLPARWKWWRGIAGVLAVAVAAASVTAPAALKAKHAAEGDPYAAYLR